jgi:hypothetical protein
VPQLVSRNDPMLASGEFGYPEVGCGDFPVHYTGKSPHPPSLPSRLGN